MKLTNNLAAMRAGFGAVAWALVTYWIVRDLRSFQWASSLLLFAALVLMPLLLTLVADRADDGVSKKILGFIEWFQLPAAIALMLATGRPPGAATLGWAVPWVMLMALLALVGIRRIWRRGGGPLWALSRDAGMIFAAVGGAWTAADRFGLHPLGFGSDIVQLTAVHFHFAGIVLPVIAGCVLREFPGSRSAAAAGWGVLAGVPLVAVGITGSQLGAPPALELFSALVLAVSAMAIGGLQVRLVRQGEWSMPVRVLFVVAGTSLIFGMVLAAMYSLRSLALPLPWLDIPWMRALHGTANALGFALCAVIGWTLARGGESPELMLKAQSTRGAQGQQRRQKPKRR